MPEPTDLVTLRKDGHDDDVIPRWALPAREADGWKSTKQPVPGASEKE